MFITKRPTCLLFIQVCECEISFLPDSFVKKKGEMKKCLCLLFAGSSGGFILLVLPCFAHTNQNISFWINAPIEARPAQSTGVEGLQVHAADGPLSWGMCARLRSDRGVKLDTPVFLAACDFGSDWTGVFSSVKLSLRSSFLSPPPLSLGQLV